MHVPPSLSAVATPRDGRLGRAVAEEPDTVRSTFQRDRDRIIHSTAFRRLQGKTQVFLAGEGDHYRTRLTHTLEVAQIARDMARALSLNEDLCECIALAHDLGHPPFGHSGETVLHAWMTERGGTFEHNQQSYRIVTLLERHGSHVPGLNLNREVTDGLLKHTAHRPDGTPVVPTPEAALVNLADELAYCAHDADDGLRAGLFTFDELLTVPLAGEAAAHATERGTAVRGALLHVLIMDVLQASSADDIRLSSSMRENLNALRAFLWERLYLHPAVHDAAEAGAELIGFLATSLFTSPTENVLALQRRTASTLAEAVKDYVAGMTDRFAVHHAKQAGLDRLPSALQRTLFPS